MTKFLARILAPEIRVNAISPGLVDTELTKEFGRYREQSIARTPLGRLVTAEEVARATLAVARDLTGATGMDLVVDGGRVLT